MGFLRGQRLPWPPNGGHGFFGKALLKSCFIDEAGDLGDPPRPNDQQVLVIGGLFVDAENLAALTANFMDLKIAYFPALAGPFDMRLDRILLEIKGSDLRRNATRRNAKRYSHTIGFLNNIFGLLHRYDVRMVARIWIKPLGGQFEGKSVYTSSIQSICRYFEHNLATTGSVGHCIADSRDTRKNSNVSHSIFTQKFGKANCYRHLIEVPTFGHSNNHAGLQICDIVCSALLYPIACFAYCAEHVDNVHVQSDAAKLRNRYGWQLDTLQHRYWNPTTERYEGGIVVSDAVNRQSGSLMFRA